VIVIVIAIPIHNSLNIFHIDIVVDLSFLCLFLISYFLFLTW